MMNKKIIAIYFSEPEPRDYPFVKQDFFEIYRDIIADIESKHDIEIYIANEDCYCGGGVFKRGWKFDNKGTLQRFAGEIRSDLVFNRGDSLHMPDFRDCKVINHPDLDEICRDKIKTAELFPELSAKTAPINSFRDVSNIMSLWNLAPEQILVLKKNFLTGHGVKILPVKKISENLFDNWEKVLAQEFMDGSVGIPGLVEGPHDLRVTVINEVAINSFIRTPAPGKWVANIGQGGSGRSIDLNDVPEPIWPMLDKIKNEFRKFSPSLYAADFMKTPQGFKLIEIESHAGVQHPNWSKTYKTFNNAVIDLLVNAVNS